MSLIPLGKFNKAKKELWRESNKPRKNGLACPRCDHELIDINPLIVLTDYRPPRLTVKCPKCKWNGYRHA